MALDGSGNFTLPHDFTTDKAGGIKPQAVRFDANFTAVEEALDSAIYRTGVAAFEADQSMGGFKITDLADPATSTDALSLGYADARYLSATTGITAAQIAEVAGGSFPINVSLSSSVAANALTIALKTSAGNDPDADDIVLLPFRSTTATSSVITWLPVTAATSLVISSGSTLGTFGNNVPFRVWVVAFNDAGTIRLGAIQCYSPQSLSGAETINGIRRLRFVELASSTAEGGAGAADSAATFYTGTAVTTKAYCVLGYLEWDSGLATNGSWAADATFKQAYGPGVSLPGDVVNVAYEIDVLAATGTTALPFDNTIPQNTEGDQYMSQAITPTSKINILDIRHIGQYASSNTNSGITVALFQDTTANALSATTFARDGAAGVPAQGQLHWFVRAGTISSTTFKIRAGTAGAGTTTFNGSAGAGLFNTTLLSSLVISEIMV